MFIESRRAVGGAVMMAALWICGSGSAQERAQMQAPQPQAAEQTAVQQQAQVPPTADAPPQAPAPVHVQWTKKSKTPYTGPTAVLQLPPTPMLDEEGTQRLDPDGKPMFNPPVKQQRDKYGHPLFDAQGKPVYQTATELGYDENGKKLHEKKEKPPKTTSVSIAAGTLTVDGMIGKAALNYDIADLHYIYLYAPWIGVVVVSNGPFPGSKMQADAFNLHTLTVNVEDHQLQLYSEKLLLGKKPAPAYVAVDREFKLPTKAPVMGYGETLKAPYNWPGAKEQVALKGTVGAPPVPESLKPVALLPKCPAGQMRAVTKVALPGETAPPPPCVPIVAGKPAVAVTPAAGSVTAPSAPVSASATPPSQE
jgi:hypothetical protein